MYVKPHTILQDRDKSLAIIEYNRLKLCCKLPWPRVAIESKKSKPKVDLQSEKSKSKIKCGFTK